MKNLILFFLLTFSCSTFAQTIRRCNNNAVVTGINIYSTIQAAHDAAVAGDIIYVEPSVTDYGSVDVRKRLTIIGNGYFLDKNTNVPFDQRTTKISSIIFNNGSANGILTGFELTGGGSVNVNDVNITVTRCKIPGVSFGISTNLVAGQNSRGNNATITKCIVGMISGVSSTIVTDQRGYNCTITNNIQQSTINSITNSIIANNVYYLFTTPSGNMMNGVNGCTISNNIYDARGLTGTIQYVSTGTGNTISNNICLDLAGSPSGNGNVSFGNSTTTFLTANPWSTFTYEDASFQLAIGSPAIGIGTGGTNVGAFGGASPYILSGLPAYPVMTNFTTSGVGNTTTPLQVNVTVRGNN